MMHTSLRRLADTLAPGRGRRAGPVDRAASICGVWRRRRAIRAELRRLLETDPRLLADIGLDPEAAASEIAKPFWIA